MYGRISHCSRCHQEDRRFHSHLVTINARIEYTIGPGESLICRGVNMDGYLDPIGRLRRINIVFAGVGYPSPLARQLSIGQSSSRP